MIQQTIRTKLSYALHPSQLDIVDESHLHAGHAGVPAGSSGETHFRIAITSAAFSGLSRVKRHQLVYTILAEELKTPVHALSLQLLAPDDAC